MRHVFCHVPNGGGRSPAEAAVMKALGAQAGVADLLLVAQGGRAHWIELKPPGRSQSPAQKTFEGRMKKLGSRYAVAHSLEEVVRHLKSWGMA